jgi:prepilin-type N-terminal cleavage/methylation domain-containing protein
MNVTRHHINGTARRFRASCARTREAAFTLLELLVVIGIIALLASMGIGALRGFNAVNVVSAGSRQLLDDINMARNHALNQRTTVYMVFVPLMQVGFDKNPLTDDQKKFFTNRMGGQLTSYNFMTLRSPGDQPGKGRPRYLSEWKHLPEHVYIPAEKFFPLPTAQWQARALAEDGMSLPMPQMLLPFPTVDSPKTNLPCIAFTYRGELVGPDATKPRQRDEYLSLTRGSIIYQRDAAGRLLNEPPELIETPRGNSTNNPWIRIDWITGRARIEERK